MFKKLTGYVDKEARNRLRTLPRDYRGVFYQITKFLWRFSSNHEDIKSVQIDILDMFETGAQEGKDVFDIVGNDVIGFCDDLLGTVSGHTLMDGVKSSMNQKIHKKLGRKTSGGK
jgi:DNA-binding ferritin-like protein (Dps family)